MPTCNYEIDYFTVTKDGTLLFDDRADSEEVERYLKPSPPQALNARRTTARNCPPKKNPKPSTLRHRTKLWGLWWKSHWTRWRLATSPSYWTPRAVSSKKALGVDTLPIEIQEDRVAFPWFPELPDADSVKAYTHFISALCEMSKNAKRVTVTEKAVENEKYAFRCFLLRLGFIGAEYKAERKILLKNLTGSSAFKSGSKKEVPGDGISE